MNEIDFRDCKHWTCLTAKIAAFIIVVLGLIGFCLILFQSKAGLVLYGAMVLAATPGYIILGLVMTKHKMGHKSEQQDDP